jgi:glycosyltransferase involved in cell wall biosynthesis
MAIGRFIVVSGYFPPVIGGTSTVVRNLLSAFKPESFAVVSESPDSFDGVHNAPVPAGVRVRRVGVPAFVTRHIPYGTRITRWLRFALVPRIAGLIGSEARRIGAEKIVAVYPSWPFLIAAYIAHRRTGLPLATYYMDVSPLASQVGWPDRIAIKLFESKILREASERLVLSEAISEDFQSRLSLSSTVIPHSIDVARLKGPALWPAESKRLIVHTGVVEGLQREGLLRLADTIAAHPELNAKLVLATPTPKSELLANGFDRPFIEIALLTNDEVRALQRAASVLVAVLPFYGAISAYQRTAFPTKVVEYMAAGVPILAHAPADSYFASHARMHGYAVVVDQPELNQLHCALNSLLEDETARRETIRRATATLREVYALENVAARFATACGLAPELLT